MPSSGHWISQPLFMNRHPVNLRRRTIARMKGNMLHAANSNWHAAEVRNSKPEIRICPCQHYKGPTQKPRMDTNEREFRMSVFLRETVRWWFCGGVSLLVLVS